MVAFSTMTKKELLAELTKVRDGRDAQITELRSENRLLRGQVEDLEEVIRTGNTGPTIVALEAKVVELTEEVDTLNAELEATKDKLEEVQTELATAEMERDESDARALEAENECQEIEELRTAMDVLDRARVDLDYRGYLGSEAHRQAALVLEQALNIY